MTDYTIIQQPSLIVLGIECRTSNSATGSSDISKHWERFYRENVINQISNKISQEILALYCDYERDHTQPYSLVIGCQISSLNEIPEGMVVKFLPASSYAVFRSVGEHPKSLIETWGKIWKMDLKRTYTGDYEVYGSKFFSGAPKEVEIYVAIDQA